MFRLVGSVLLLLLIALGGSRNGAEAQTIDPHKVYEQKCGSCHAPHAGDFVHDNLILSGKDVLGRKTGKEVRAFLEAGHGKLTSEEIDAIAPLLTQIRLSGQLFHNKCLICHDRAARFARAELDIRDGKLVGRYSGRDVEEFLKHHGRLEPDEVPKMVTVLKRQLETAAK